MICQVLIRLSATLLALGWLAACQFNPILDHREVPARLSAALQAHSRAPTNLELRGEDILIDAAITAREPVTMGMRLRDGVPVVPIRINRGSAVPFVVDTGSQGCVMEARTAVAHDVVVLDHENAFMVLGGTTGDERARIGLPDEVAIGSWLLQRYPFFVRTHETRVRLGTWKNHVISLDLIGMSVILKSCHYLTLDFPRKKIVFGIGGEFLVPSSQRSWKAPLILRDGLPYVRLQTDGNTWEALLDSGFNGLLDMDEATARRLHLLEKAQPTEAFRAGLGSPEKNKPTQMGVILLSQLDGLGPRMVNIPTLIVPQRSKIGCSMLNPFRVTLDFDRQLLWLEDPRQAP
jgi:hypothetical protein